MKTSDFDYVLPQELIAQTPVEPRDNSRLMVVNRADDSIEHRRFYDIVDYLRAGDVLVFNESLVIPARLYGRKVDSGGRVEILLLRRLEEGIWEALVRRGKRLRIGSWLSIGDEKEENASPTIMAEVVDQDEGGIKVIRFSDETVLSELGKVPLPPYINTPLSHPERYQTVYARVAGSVAAPTAGLHFTPELLDRLEKKGVRLLFICLHIGLDTFSPVREEDPGKHHIHREYGIVSKEVAGELSEAKRQGRRVICVGTTTVRILEQVAQLYQPEQIQPFADWVSLYILPGHRFRMVDALLTNYHLPRSTLLMLVTAFAGKKLIDNAYREAINAGNRFYSFGDAMLIL
ncbi:MAG: tRNA preQ1(34) S-adenosylmethionine ribosyltransferase-isomerase QueA [Chloroflexi bacterium]|nr:tRNA preQ1(34) S-adenosylmethionine ribosyltransferase-isomerase QueA [Chloroflexota bacterium]